MDTFAGDVRYGLRLMARSPLFTAVAVGVLALGIGANTAIFSVVNAIVLRPLPLRDSDRLAVVWETSVGQGWSRVGPSGPNYVDFKEQSTSFDDLAALELGSATITGLGEPQQIPGLRVSTNYLSVLGAAPLIGRDFTHTEGWQDRVAIISYGFWERNLGLDPAVIGSRVTADDLPYTIIGVLPRTFWSPVPSDLLVPWSTADLRAKGRTDHNFGVIGRLRRGVSAERANAEMTSIEQRIGEHFLQLKGWGTTVVPLHRLVGEDLGASLLVLLAAVGFVLLIACANIANLLLARAVARQRETAIRRALGATRARLVRQFLSESVLLGLAGGGVGLLFALWGVDVLDTVLPATFRVTAGGEVMRPPLSIDAAVLAFTMLIAVGTGLVFGLVPALTATRAGADNANEGLKEGARSSAGGHSRTRQALIVSEIALTLVLLVAAALTIKSFWRLQQVNPGFAADHVLALEMELPTDAKYLAGAEQAAFFERVLAQAHALPGVTHAAVANVLPLDSTVADTTEFLFPDRPLLAGGQRLPADSRAVSADYFATMGIPLKRGRVFTDADRTGRPLVAIVDETLARMHFGDGRNPIGQQVRIGNTDLQIVGVVGAVKQAGLDRQPAPTVYFSHLQANKPRMDLVVRTAVDPASMITAVKGAVYAIDKDQPVYKIRTMRQAVSDATSSQRLTFVLLGLFAVAACALASIGIYGVVAYTVAQRTREIGIRLALGADGGRIVRMIVTQGLATTVTGVGVGLVLAVVATQALAAMLFGVGAHDPGVFIATAATLTSVAVIASYVPARRAARVDPAVALRSE